MKSVTAVCASSLSASVASGRVHRQRRDVENEEIQMYLSKLKELVPCIPKNRRLSKLEVIQHVIDYIGDLQFALETHPSVVASVNSALTTGAATTAVAAAVVASSVASRTGAASTNAATAGSTSPRQPLGVLAPNTIAPCNTSSSCATQEQTAPGVHSEKVTSADSRPVSC